MLDDNFVIGAVAEKAMSEYPSFRWREKNPLIHNASDSGKCGRQLSYKALKYPESNPPDLVGKFRMFFGNALEAGLKYNLFGKMAPFGVLTLNTQGDAGELGGFYGTSWHGYRDFDFGVKQSDGKYKRVVVELKTKVGFGASAMIKETPYSKNFRVPDLDFAWGYPHQLALYLRNAYENTKDEKCPIVDGVLLYYLHDDGGISGFVEYHATYLPESDSVEYYSCKSAQFKACNGPIKEVVVLKDIADKWKEVDESVKKGELAAPGYQRRYQLDDPRVENAYKSHLQAAVKNQKLIGDMQCAYCSFKDQCAKDLKIELSYSADELKVLKRILADK